jgi:asparagine synthetase B (glutamine-hydrolysing)
MLFDLFALVDFSDGIKTAPADPFASQDGYKALKYHDEVSNTAHASIRSLYKKQADALSFYGDDSLEIYIYGYCFPRSGSQFFKEHKRLKASEIAFGYSRLQQHLLKEIKGSFSMLIYDKKAEQLQVFTDPLNVRPMYYYQHDKRLAISTSLSAVMQYMKASNQPVKIDGASVLEYYLFEYVLGDETYIQSVRTMPPGGWLSFNSAGLELRRYWNAFEDLKDFKIRYSEAAAIEKLEDVIKHNLDLYLSGNRPTAVALTGGYDSRTNLALLGEKAKKFQFYSYGIKNTYDLEIPQKIAQDLGLKFRPIYLEQEYEKEYSANAREAILIGDGIAEANRANYLYAFKQLGKEYDSILTGLFGSELIKHPTSVGNFIDQHMKSLLNSDDPAAALREVLAKSVEAGYIKEDMLEAQRSELEKRVLNNPYVVNRHKRAVKYFYFLLMVGVRKYFMKEMKVERPYVENLHPFLDIEFVETLLQTPFPWVYHWTGEKNLVKSIQTHRFYVSLIHKNQPRLSSILSTHGYKPRYLLNKVTLPLMSLQYWYYKDKIKARSSFNSLEPIWKYFSQHPVNGKYASWFDNKKLQTVRNSDAKNNIKLSSLQHWFSTNGIKL